MEKKIEINKNLKMELPKEVAEKYKLKTIRPGKYNFYGFGEIDLRTISLKKADELVKGKFPYLILKKVNPPKEKKDNKKQIT